MSRMATPGSLLPGGFVLGRLSHADRVGLVYRAHHAENKDGRAAAALVLHPLHVEELREWFEKMAVLGRSLRHPNLVEVYALGYTANELPVVVTEWVDGKTGRNELASGRTFSPVETAQIIREVASALDYLHHRTPPVLHRVIMPESVLLSSPSGAVKLLSVGHADRPHHPAAKPSYLSPEELSGEAQLTPQSDIFSLASLAYELLTGQVAFNGNPHTILAAIYRAAWPRLGANEGAEEVEAVLQSAWSLDPTKRPVSAGAFADELGAALERVPGGVTTARRASSVTPMRAPTYPGPGSVAPTPSPTGRFAAASLHADSLRASRPAAAVGRGSAGVWSPPPNPSVASPLVVSGTSAYAAAARTSAASVPAPGVRASSAHPTGSWEARAQRTETQRPPSPDGDSILAEDITLPGDKNSATAYQRPANDDGVGPGTLDDLLRQGARLVDDDTSAAASPAPTSRPVRKDPLFVPVAADPTGRQSDAWAAGVRRNSGEFPPAARRLTGEFPPGVSPTRRNTGEFPPGVAPARRNTGEFPPGVSPTRRNTGEFPPGAAPVRRNTGEFPPAVAHARRTGEFPPASALPRRGTGEFPPASALPRRNTGEFPPASAASRRATGEFPPASRRPVEAPAAHVSTSEPPTAEIPPGAEVGTVDEQPTRKLVATPQNLPAVVEPARPSRSAFERDAFAPAAPAPEHDGASRSRSEVRVTWPVVMGFILANTAVTGAVVYGLSVMNSRTPSVVYVPQTPTEPRGAPFDTTTGAIAPEPLRVPSPAVLPTPLPVPTPLPTPTAAPVVEAPIAPPPTPARRAGSSAPCRRFPT